MKRDEHLYALLAVRAGALAAIRKLLDESGFLEVTPAALTNFGGVCEDIDSMFEVEYYGRRAFLAQTAQLQLEYLVAETRRSVWTIGHSYRYEKRGKQTEGYLAEFTLIELEVVDSTLEQVIEIQRQIVRAILATMIGQFRAEIAILGGSSDYLKRVADSPMPAVRYEEAIDRLRSAGKEVIFGDNLDRECENMLLRIDNPTQTPLFVTHYPSQIKYFNMKRDVAERLAINVDLLAPPFGEVSGGAEREVDTERLFRVFQKSPLPSAMVRRGVEPTALDWYFDLHRQGRFPERAGFGIGFERLVGMLMFNPESNRSEQSVTNCLEFPRTREKLVP